METVIVLGALPARIEGFSQAPPWEVVGVIVNFRVPVPPLPMYRLCGVTFVPPFFMEKLISPGRLLKNGPEASTVSVTGTVIVRAGLRYSPIHISPLSTRAGSVLALTEPTHGWGVSQRT